jgi:starch phosphorylase
VEGPREGQIQIGEPIALTALARLGALTPDDVRVELVYGQDRDGALRERCVVAMERKGKAEHGAYRYHATIHPETTGSLVYGVRVTPAHPGLASPYEMGLAHWA